MWTHLRATEHHIKVLSYEITQYYLSPGIAERARLYPSQVRWCLICLSWGIEGWVDVTELFVHVHSLCMGFTLEVILCHFVMRLAVVVKSTSLRTKRSISQKSLLLRCLKFHWTSPSEVSELCLLYGIEYRFCEVRSWCLENPEMIGNWFKDFQGPARALVTTLEHFPDSWQIPNACSILWTLHRYNLPRFASWTCKQLSEIIFREVVPTSEDLRII